MHQNARSRLTFELNRSLCVTEQIAIVLEYNCAVAAFGFVITLERIEAQIQPPTERKSSTCLIKSFGLSLISQIWGGRYANVHTFECKFHAFFPLPLIPVTYGNTSTSELWFHFVMWSGQFQIMGALQIKSLPLLST